MKTVYDTIASVELPSCALKESQRQRILETAMAQIDAETGSTVRPAKHWSMVWRVAAVAAVLCCLGTIGVAAASRFLKPSEVAGQMQQDELAALFAGTESTEIQQTQQAGGYTVTLLGLTTGENATGFWSSAWADGMPEHGRHYAVLAVTHTDGTPMAELSEEDGDLTLTNSLVSPVFASPECPLMDYNVFTMQGARHDLVQDGVRYILVETDTLEPFADQDPQLAVILGNTGGISALLNGFVQDPESGAITLSDKGEGTRILFDLPIDENKADPARAEELRRQWFTADSQTAGDATEDVLQYLATLTPEQVREQGVLLSRETVTLSDGPYGRGWYDGNGGFLAQQHDDGDSEEEYVASCTGDGQIVLLTHQADDTMTVEMWQMPVS